MDKHQKKWREQNPQMSVCLPRKYYDMLFPLAKQQRYQGVAHLVRALLIGFLDSTAKGVPVEEAWQSTVAQRVPTAQADPNAYAYKPSEITPAGKLPKRTSPILPSGGVWIDRSKPQPLPQLPGIPAGQGHLIREEPEDITAEASRLV